MSVNPQSKVLYRPCEPISHDGIVWLASYPKSGNTWFRIFLRHLRSDSDESIPLKSIGFGMASVRQLFDHLTGLDSSDLTHNEIDQFRPRLYRDLVQDAEALPCFMKTHDAYTYLDGGLPLFPSDATAGAIYLVRNPLDVAVSFAFHGGHQNFDQTIQMMGNKRSAFCKSHQRLASQLRQQLLDWSGHVASWLESNIPLQVIRYEDMLESPLESFSQAVSFLALPYSKQEVHTALELSRFDRLQERERELGFHEKMPGCKNFFREGKSGTWRDHLNEDQAQTIINDHKEFMIKLGYLKSDGSPVY